MQNTIGLTEERVNFEKILPTERVTKFQLSKLKIHNIKVLRSRKDIACRHSQSLTMKTVLADLHSQVGFQASARLISCIAYVKGCAVMQFCHYALNQ